LNKLANKTSSFIDSYAYSEAFMLLVVKFSTRSTWIYYNVSKEEYEDFMNSKSIGKYFNDNIRNQKDSSKVF
jgi:hypothetical protein